MFNEFEMNMEMFDEAEKRGWEHNFENNKMDIDTLKEMLISLGGDLSPCSDDDFEPNIEKLKQVFECLRMLAEYKNPEDVVFPIEISPQHQRIDIILRAFNIDVMNEKKELLLEMISMCDMFAVETICDGIEIEFIFYDTYIKKDLL